MPSIAVVIPCFKVTSHILQVIDRIGSEVTHIYVVDDCCPDGTGILVNSECTDDRVQVIFHDINKGVGGATITGLRAALKDGADIIIKLDGDGQKDTSLIPQFTRPIVEGYADYTKGNRFYSSEGLQQMPL